MFSIMRLSPVSGEIIYSRGLHPRGLHSLILGREHTAQASNNNLRESRCSIQTRSAGKYLLRVRHLHTSIPVCINVIEPNHKILNAQKDLDLKIILNLEVDLPDDPKMTIRSYLHKLLSMVWEDGECFDGKRPFGNSDWEHDLYKPLIKEGYISGTLDEWGEIKTVDAKAGKRLIFDVIDYLFKGTKD